MDAVGIVVEKLRSQTHEGIEGDMEVVREAYAQLMEVLKQVG